MVSVILMSVGRSFGTTSGTFSCGFEEMSHKLSWDAMLLMVGFLVFEFEIIFILLMIMEGTLIVFMLIVFVMVWELKTGSFSL